MKRICLFFTVLLSACQAGQLFAQSVVTADTSAVVATDEESGLLKQVENWYADNMNYWSITALMAVESSFIPFPSEVVVPPAAYVAENEGSALNTTGNYPLNVLLIVLFASLGAMIGACINYALSIWLGRPVIYKFADSKAGHLLLLSGEKIKKAEDYFNEHGKISTFIGRLIPAVRQLISIPAGLARMPFGTFLLYTFLGAFFWNIILALLGYVAHGQADLIDRYNKELSVAIIAVAGVAVVVWIIVRIVRGKRNRKEVNGEGVA